MNPIDDAIRAAAAWLFDQDEGCGPNALYHPNQPDHFRVEYEAKAAAIVTQITPLLTGPLQAKLDAAEAEKRQAVERERRMARRIHMQRAQLRWLNAWMMGNLQSTRMNMLKKTLLTKRKQTAFGPDPASLRADWDVILRRVYGTAAIRTAPVHKAGCPGTGSRCKTGGRP